MIIIKKSIQIYSVPKLKFSTLKSHGTKVINSIDLSMEEFHKIYVKLKYFFETYLLRIRQ